MTTPADRARACFALAASTTFAGEREAAIGRGMALIERHGLDPGAFDIPGREHPHRSPRGVELDGLFASIFGACVGCGAVAVAGVMCRACLFKAEAARCRHGYHGYCMLCDGDGLDPDALRDWAA